ncbi:MAG: tetratricopeptide repeat protein, partial [Intestinibacter sp.]
MRDFREVSTMELFFNITTDFKIKIHKFEELFKEQMSKMATKSDSKDIKKELKNEKDFKMTAKNMKNIRKSVILELEKQAEEGDVDTQFSLGDYYFVLNKENDNEENNKNAFKWYKKAAENGLPDAQYNLAGLYMNGLGIEENREKAFEWYEKVAEQGHIESKLCLAICYEQGIGTDMDEKKAFNIVKSIEDKNNPDIEYCLGVYYEL